MKTDVVVIGAGPGGYVAAIRLAQLGKRVVLVEKAKLGGTCLQMGCIPSKALIAVSKEFEHIQNAAKLGIQIPAGVNINFSETQAWKNKILDQLTRGIGALCKGNKVDVLTGQASFTSPHAIRVKSESVDESVEFDQCIIATGSVPIQVPGFIFDGKHVLSSTEALSLNEVPKRLVVIGGGYIGLELGSLYAKLGTLVTVVEMTPSLLPGFDPEAIAVVEKKLRRNKVEILVETKALGYSEKGGALQIELDRKGEKIPIEADKILVTVGRKPTVHGLNLEAAGLKTNEKGFVAVSNTLQTSVPHIYAIGDVAGQPMLAHKASKEAEIAAEHIAGKNSVYDVRSVPAVVFTDPEISSVGLSEAEAKAQGHKIKIGKFPFAASGKALISGSPEGFVKVIAEADSNVLLGVLIVGSEAATMISEACVLIEMGATAEDLALTVHPHPTTPESLMEAAKAILGEAVHTMNVK